MIPSQIPRQRDFSGGEIDEEASRRDDAPLIRAGARQMSNKRILSSGALAQRPGRRALFRSLVRTEEIRFSAALAYYISFGPDRLRVYDAAGAVLFTQAGYPWVDTTVKDVVWERIDNQVFVTFSGVQPKVLTVPPLLLSSLNSAPGRQVAASKVSSAELARVKVQWSWSSGSLRLSVAGVPSVKGWVVVSVIPQM